MLIGGLCLCTYVLAESSIKESIDGYGVIIAAFLVSEEEEEDREPNWRII
jgi:hypothetical protein